LPTSMVGKVLRRVLREEELEVRKETRHNVGSKSHEGEPE
jgi:hypothetical protein